MGGRPSGWGQGRFRAQSSQKQSILGHWDALRRVWDYANGELVEGEIPRAKRWCRKQLNVLRRGRDRLRNVRKRLTRARTMD